jgi:phosphoketolase
MKLGGFSDIKRWLTKWLKKIFLNWFVVGAVFISLDNNGYRVDSSLIFALLKNYSVIITNLYQKIIMTRDYLAALR